MTKKIISTPNAPAAVGPYSQAVMYGNMLFCSGQIPINPANQEVMKSLPVEEQASLVMKNIEAVLKAADCNFTNIVKTTIFLTDMNDFAKVNAVYEKYFTEAPPARSTIQVAGLPKGVQVEIEVLAAKN
ncbi:MAG: RidA family protein [Bdellovibrionota bacterium]